MPFTVVFNDNGQIARVYKGDISAGAELRQEHVVQRITKEEAENHCRGIRGANTSTVTVTTADIDPCIVQGSWGWCW